MCAPTIVAHFSRWKESDFVDHTLLSACGGDLGTTASARSHSLTRFKSRWRFGWDVHQRAAFTIPARSLHQFRRAAARTKYMAIIIVKGKQRGQKIWTWPPPLARDDARGISPPERTRPREQAMEAARMNPSQISDPAYDGACPTSRGTACARAPCITSLMRPHVTGARAPAPLSRPGGWVEPPPSPTCRAALLSSS